jgi:hypothetical protein
MDSLVVFYYLIASEIWLDERVAFDGSGIIRRGLLYTNEVDPPSCIWLVGYHNEVISRNKNTISFAILCLCYI